MKLIAMFLDCPSLFMPPAFVRDGLASQTSTAHTLLYWHYRITRMDVLIGHVCEGGSGFTPFVLGSDFRDPPVAPIRLQNARYL